MTSSEITDCSIRHSTKDLTARIFCYRPSLEKNPKNLLRQTGRTCAGQKLQRITGLVCCFSSFLSRLPGRKRMLNNFSFRRNWKSRLRDGPTAGYFVNDTPVLTMKNIYLNFEAIIGHCQRGKAANEKCNLWWSGGRRWFMTFKWFLFNLLIRWWCALWSVGATSRRTWIELMKSRMVLAVDRGNEEGIFHRHFVQSPRSSWLLSPCFNLHCFKTVLRTAIQK